ncbi:phosphodiester glycosidase family protein [Luteipulveratus flavus]|uniref:Phosphodiester glycosidase family protein n=1 Tax=Luteipulveratus flavus TaxID=3031728 RepID=A0ABT6CBD2_9MICO|nr:phosphodiester glycosidase family protein [Luteipulveratus sp. YIM 133296]MDF8265632.1 phosphodiester glycosidase family protein [Luteipulveratus sp. YIM 133296]
MTTRRLPRALAATVALLASLALASPSYAADEHLPLGDADLPESRTTRTLADGVTLTSITRGSEPADPSQIDTTTRGPWNVKVLTIDPDVAKGRLTATYGPDIARAETTTDLVRDAKAMIGVNASFFTFTANPTYPGDPVGLGVYRGVLHSEPSSDKAENDLVVDGSTGRMLIGRTTWSGDVTNRSGARIGLESVDHPPVVPTSCAALPDQTQCAADGDTTLFTDAFGASTPSGAGVEVVLDRRGCVVRTTTARGTTLTTGQSSIQATGSDTADLLRVAPKGCVEVRSTLRDESGRRVRLSDHVSGVNGRYRLTRDGQVVVPAGTGSFFARNPRTIAGRTADGRIVLAVIDGRQTTSVGTTMDETAAVAHSLGLVDSLNLDGGGSSTMSTPSGPLNHPSGTGERLVGDALVWQPSR